MLLRTDDDIYRARLLYLGPPGYTLPVQLPYAQWGVGALLALTAVVGGFLLGFGVPWVGAELAVALFATSFIFRYVDPDRPARKLVATVATDWRRTEPQQAGPLPHLNATNIRIGGLR